MALETDLCEADRSVLEERRGESVDTRAEVGTLFETDDGLLVGFEDAESVTEAAVDASLEREAKGSWLFDTEKAVLLEAEVADFAPKSLDRPLSVGAESSVLETVRFAPLKLNSAEADFMAKEVALLAIEPAGVPLCVEAEPGKMLEPGTSAEYNDG